MMGFGDFLWMLMFAFLGVFSVVWSKRLYAFWFTPLSLFFIVNCTSLCAYHLRLVEMKDVSLVTHLGVVACLLAFALGCALGAIGRRVPPPETMPGAMDDRGLALFFYTTAGIATAGWLLAAFILFMRHRGFGLLLANIWLLQSEFQMQGIGYLNMLGILVLPAYLLRRARGKGSLFDMLLVTSAIWGLLLAGIKAFVFYSVLTALGTWGVANPSRLRPRHLLVMGMVLVGFFVAYNARIDIFTLNVRVAEGSPLARVRALQWPYVYFVGAWPATQNIADGLLPPPSVPGAMTFYAVWKVAGDLLGLIESVPFAQAFTNIGPAMFNVYSIFGVLYQEWTWPGAAVACCLLGFIGSRLYLRARRAGYWGHVLVYGLFSYGLSMSCFMYVYRFNEAVLFIYLYVLGFVMARHGVLVDRREQ